MLTKELINISLIIGGALISIIFGLLVYRMFLTNYIGSFVNPYLCKIPILGKLITGTDCKTEGYRVADSTSLTRGNIAAVRPKLGARGGTMQMGHGKHCAWFPEHCNIWENTKLKEINKEFDDPGTENERILDLEVARSAKFQQIQEPMSRKVYQRFSGLTSNQLMKNINSKKKQMTGDIASIFGSTTTGVAKIKGATAVPEHTSPKIV